MCESGLRTIRLAIESLKSCFFVPETRPTQGFPRLPTPISRKQHPYHTQNYMSATS